jgi:hypothetical protein
VVQAPVLQPLMRHSSITTTLRFYTEIDKTLDGAEALTQSFTQRRLYAAKQARISTVVT